MEPWSTLFVILDYSLMPFSIFAFSVLLTKIRYHYPHVVASYKSCDTQLNALLRSISKVPTWV